MSLQANNINVFESKYFSIHASSIHQYHVF